MTPQFVDTNILLYAYDSSAGDKHERAAELVLRLARTGQGALSVQVLQEFYVNAVFKIARPLTHEQALLRLRALSQWYVHSPLASDVLAAAELRQRYQLSLWDAMIIQSASRLGCQTLWTEDLNASQVISGVAIRNPLVAPFVAP
ncbi:MAG: PIN domain-containing protein [Propionibacteriaceae bacterium]|jgi:predicted nucleic acid-binding protein|nr:PIN domain-containing protein [Propionibacteriaceae bacterium]